MVTPTPIQELLLFFLFTSVIILIVYLMSQQLKRSNKMDLIALLNGLISNLNELQAKLADAQVAVAAERQAGYDEGFAAGVASVVVDPEKKFSQAEVDALIAAAIPPAVDAAVAALKADLKSKYMDQQVAENAGETGFGSLLD